MGKGLLNCMAIGLFVLLGGNSFASVIWDQSPITIDASLGANLGNIAWGQNFADKVTFANGATVTGMDIYNTRSYGALGDTMTIRIWSDNQGDPGLLLYQTNSAITGIYNEANYVRRYHADISSYQLASGTYWIGMSTLYTSDGNDIAQGSLFDKNGLPYINGGDGHLAFFQGTRFEHLTGGLGDMAFRLEGDVTTPLPTPTSPVPEPATLLLFGTGIAGLAAVGRRKRS